MREFIEKHRALILRHARAYVTTHGEKIAPEDVAREIELVLEQLAQRGRDGADAASATAAAMAAPDAYVRSIARHAVGRAKRRRTLIEQLAAGDDLAALSSDLAALDRDLPAPPPPVDDEARAARATLDRLKDALPPRDALVFALLFEDDGDVDGVAAAIGSSADAVSAARERILEAASRLGVAPELDARAARET